MFKPLFGALVVCSDWKGPGNELTYGRVVPPANGHEHKQTRWTDCYIVEDLRTGDRRIVNEFVMYLDEEDSFVEGIASGGYLPPGTAEDLWALRGE